jgi:uncharacterized protein YgiM (DUF1202 family)
MKKILATAALAAGAILVGAAYADPTSPTGTVGTNVGTSLKQPMIVNADNGTVRIQPNATARILTKVPRGHQVTVIGTANGGAWAHIMVNGLDGYIDRTQLQNP